MATAFLSEKYYKRAEEVVKAEGKDLTEAYKALGGAFVEGTNEEIIGMRKYTAIYDEVKKKTAKKPKTLVAKKKKK